MNNLEGYRTLSNRETGDGRADLILKNCHHDMCLHTVKITVYRFQITGQKQEVPQIIRRTVNIFIGYILPYSVTALLNVLDLRGMRWRIFLLIMSWKIKRRKYRNGMTVIFLAKQRCIIHGVSPVI